MHEKIAFSTLLWYNKKKLKLQQGENEMGIYLNPENVDFQEVLNSKIYVDKSELIQYTNSVLRTTQKYICVSRPRRFGKSMAANMLTAYYSRGCDSRGLFQGLKIATHSDFEKYLNQYNVIHLNMRDYLTESENMKELIQFVEDDLLDELQQEFSDIRMPRRKTRSKYWNRHLYNIKFRLSLSSMNGIAFFEYIKVMLYRRKSIWTFCGIC